MQVFFLLSSHVGSTTSNEWPSYKSFPKWNEKVKNWKKEQSPATSRNFRSSQNNRKKLCLCIWKHLCCFCQAMSPAFIPFFERSAKIYSPYIPKNETDADICQGTPTDTPSPYKIESGWSHPIILAQTWKATFFCPTLLRHQNIKTSLSKNGWVL